MWETLLNRRGAIEHFEPVLHNNQFPVRSAALGLLHWFENEKLRSVLADIVVSSLGTRNNGNVFQQYVRSANSRRRSRLEINGQQLRTMAKIQRLSVRSPSCLISPFT